MRASSETANAPPSPPHRIGVGDACLLHVRFALFSSGFTIFGLLYYVQALLPIFSEAFDVSPAQSSLTLSVTTGVMAFALLVSGAVSDAVGRKRIMFLSLLSSSLLTVAMAFSPNWATVLVIRALMGISLCGVQSVTMAYLAEEVEPRSFAATVGLFIAGSALGGMFGRMVVSVVTDYWGWRAAVAIIGLAGLGAAAYFQAALPESRNFRPRIPGWDRLAVEARIVLTDNRQLCRFFVGFAVMSGFVTTYNYITYRLVSAPFELSQTAVGFVFVIYICGSIGAVLAGRAASRFSHARVLWLFQAVMIVGIMLTIPDSLTLVILGLAVLTFGMFASHSVASGWVSLEASNSKALAASLYLFAYYQGGSLVGALGGVVYQHGGWIWVAAMTSGIGLAGLVCSLILWAGHRE